MTVGRCKRLVVMVAAILALGTGACRLPADSEVEAAFLKDHPTFVVNGVATGEGDGTTVYKHIRFRRPGNSVECEVVWAYQEAGSTWCVFYKSDAALVGTACEACERKPCA